MNEILIIIILILLNGIFAMFEIAMIASRKSALESAEKKGDKTAKKALELIGDPGKFFATIQIGITLIGIFTGVYSGEKIVGYLTVYFNGIEWLAPYSEKVSFLVVVIILTFLSLILGELVPKRIGLAIPEKISKILSYPMYWISLIAAPFVWVLTLVTDMIFKILKIGKSEDNQITEEEIKALIHKGTQTGVVQKIEQDIVENVFYLGDRKINTLMTERKNIMWININDTYEKKISKITSSVHNSFPVCRDNIDNVVGVIHSKKVLNSLLKGEKFDIQNYLNPALLLTKNITAYQALEKFRSTKQHLALAVGDDGKIKGLITMNDLVDALVGDLVEHLHENKEIIPRKDGSFLIDANLPFQEFIRYFEIEPEGEELLPEIDKVSELAAISGISKPHTGDLFQWNEISFEIIDMDSNMIDKLLMKKMNKPETDL